MNKTFLLCCLLWSSFNVKAFLTPIYHHHNALIERIQFGSHPCFNRVADISTMGCRANTNSKLNPNNIYNQNRCYYPLSWSKSETLLRLSKKDDGNQKQKQPLSFSDRVKENPETLIIYPIVAIFFLDIVANILVVAKRTIEVIFTGQYTVWHF